MSKRKKEYILYDTSTTLPIAIGTIEECAKSANCKPETLIQLNSKYRRGIREDIKYVLYDLNRLINGYYLEEGEESEYERN